MAIRSQPQIKYAASACPAITEGWLEERSPGDLAVIWLLEVRQDRTLIWGDKPIAHAQLAGHLRQARSGTPPPRLLVRVEKGVDCGFLKQIRAEVEREYGCGVHQCLVALPPPPRRP